MIDDPEAALPPPDGERIATHQVPPAGESTPASRTMIRYPWIRVSGPPADRRTAGRGRRRVRPADTIDRRAA